MQSDLLHPIDNRATPMEVKLIKETVVPKINKETQKHVSFSQMNVYRGCGFRWKLEYKDGLKRFTSSSHTTFGTAMHETLQNYLDVLYDESEQKAEDIDLFDSFKHYFMKEYEDQRKANDGTHYMTRDDFASFFIDGLTIVEAFKKDRTRHFPKDKLHLVGCEVPVLYAPDESKPDILYLGYLDVVTYNENTGRFKIIDLKTSTNGWNKWAKADEAKQFQLLLYKRFFAKQYGIDEDRIDIEFFILRRKLYENSKWPQSHLQVYEPISGLIKTNQAVKAMTDFIDDCFDDNAQYVEREYEATPSKKSCMYCPYKKDDNLCGLGAKF